MAVRPVIVGLFSGGTSLPARVTRFNGKGVGSMLDDVTSPPAGHSYGCYKKRYCLRSCNYSLATRDLRYDYVSFVVSGIVNTTCGPATRVHPITGNTILETVECTGFAAINGTFLAPIEDYPYSWSASAACEPRIKPSSWDFTCYIRSHGTLTTPGGTVIPFDVTCEIKVNVLIVCESEGFPSLPCSGVTMSITASKQSPMGTPSQLYQATWNEPQKCKQIGDDALGLVPVGGTWYTYTPGTCSYYPECYPNTQAAVWVNNNNYGLSQCCPFSGLSLACSWV